MTTTPIPKPTRGRPRKDSNDAVAVAFMESEVVRLRKAGESFPNIDATLGITNSDRVFSRAAVKVREQSREDAYALESMRLEDLHRAAWETLRNDGLDGLADRIAERINNGDGDADGIRMMIGDAYADTLKAVPVILKVGERRDKLDGLTHGDRVADAQLVVDQTRLQVFAAALVAVLDGIPGLGVEEKRAAIVTWGQIVAASDSAE